jgi:hypothetical protein
MDKIDPGLLADEIIANDIIITPHLTLRPLLEIDADDIRALLAEKPELASAMPDDVRMLAGADMLDQGKDSGQAKRQATGTATGTATGIATSQAVRTLAVLRERMIGWIAADSAQSGFSGRGDHAVLKEEALAAARYARAQ